MKNWSTWHTKTRKAGKEGCGCKIAAPFMKLCDLVHGYFHADCHKDGYCNSQQPLKHTHTSTNKVRKEQRWDKK
jgi:hypothetical protein